MSMSQTVYCRPTLMVLMSPNSPPVADRRGEAAQHARRFSFFTRRVRMILF
jgi:hypothetical protein